MAVVPAAAGHRAAQPAEGVDAVAAVRRLEAPRAGAAGLPEAEAAIIAAAGQAAAGQRAEGKDGVRVPLQGGPAAGAGSCLPQPDGPVSAAAGESALTGLAEGIDRARVARQRGDAAGRAQIPELHASVVTGAGNRLLRQAAGCPDPSQYGLPSSPRSGTWERPKRALFCPGCRSPGP